MQMISHAQVGPDARHVAAVSEHGDLLLFDISQLLQQHQVNHVHSQATRKKLVLFIKLGNIALHNGCSIVLCFVQVMLYILRLF